jgi:hypothetical protein
LICRRSSAHKPPVTSSRLVGEGMLITLRCCCCCWPHDARTAAPASPGQCDVAADDAPAPCTTCRAVCLVGRAAQESAVPYVLCMAVKCMGEGPQHGCDRPIATDPSHSKAVLVMGTPPQGSALHSSTSRLDQLHTDCCASNDEQRSSLSSDVRPALAMIGGQIGQLSSMALVARWQSRATTDCIPVSKVP